MKKVSLPRGLVYVRSQHTFTATWISLNRENFDVVGISKMRIELTQNGKKLMGRWLDPYAFYT